MITTEYVGGCLTTELKNGVVTWTISVPLTLPPTATTEELHALEAQFHASMEPAVRDLTTTPGG